MLIYLKKFFLSINLYLLFFLIWIIKQIDYSFSTLPIYQNFSIILIIIFSFTFVLLILAILNLINKKKFFQYFSVIFLSLFIINLLFDSFSEKTKNIQNEMFYKFVFMIGRKLELFTLHLACCPIFTAFACELRQRSNNKLLMG